jgi:multiple sugar transport system substrate-binding protein
MSDQNFSSAEDRNNNSPSERKDFNPPWQEQEVKKEESPPVPDQKEPKASETQTVFSPAGSPAQSPENPAEEKSELNYQAEPGAPSFAPEVEEKAKEFLSQDNSSDSRVNDSQTKPKGEVFKKIILSLLVLGFIVSVVLLVIKVVLPRFQKPKEVTLNYWGLWEAENVMQSLITEWESKNPNVKINYSQQSPQEYRERLQSALARNEGPDLFRFHITWLPMLKNELEAVPVEIMSANEFENNFYPVVKENLRSGSSFLGLPLQVDTLALFYNQQIFQAAGKTPPTTWDELRQTALDLTVRDENGRIQTAGVALGTTSNIEHWSDILGLMMLQNGVNLSQPSSNLAEDALVFYTIFNNTDRIWDETLPNSTLAFAGGKVAMYFGFSWDVFEIKNINPDLSFQVAPVPQLPGTDIAWASFWVEGVAKRSQHSKEAWQFLQFLSSQESLQELYQAQSQLRLFGELYPYPAMANLLTGNSLVAPFINQAAKAKTWYLCSRTFDNGLNDRMIKYFEDAVNAVNNQGSASEVLKTTSQGVAQLLSQYDLGSAVR